MAQYHALRVAGSTGGEDNFGDVVRLRPIFEIGQILRRSSQIGDRELRQRRIVRNFAVTEHGAGAGRFGDAVDEIGRQMRIERNRDQAGLETSEVGRHQLRIGLAAQQQAGAGSEAGFVNQTAGNPLSHLQQAAVAPTVVAQAGSADQGNPLRKCRRRALQKIEQIRRLGHGKGRQKDWPHLSQRCRDMSIRLFRSRLNGMQAPLSLYR